MASYYGDEMSPNFKFELEVLRLTNAKLVTERPEIEGEEERIVK